MTTEFAEGERRAEVVVRTRPLLTTMERLFVTVQYRHGIDVKEWRVHSVGHLSLARQMTRRGMEIAVPPTGYVVGPKWGTWGGNVCGAPVLIDNSLGTRECEAVIDRRVDRALLWEPA